MTPKERTVMQQALEALEESCYPRLSAKHTDRYEEAITALQEALDHSGEANEMVIGWDRVKPEAIASDPLYQQGFVDGVEEGRNQVAEQAEQSQLADASLEPVAWAYIDKDGSFMDALDRQHGAYKTPLYASPLAKQDTHATHVVRTKDLTDDEICFWIGRFPFLLNEKSEKWVIGLARAVIAADREKNRG